MICPDCKTDNIDGADFCESCGQDLSNLDLPGANSEFEEHLMRDTLSALEPSDAPSVSPGDPVYLAVHIMQRRGVECVLVKEDGKVVGILTERDILMKVAGDKVDLNAVPVSKLMPRDPVILREQDTLAVALHKMSVGGFRHIPLVTGKRDPLVISIQDVFRHISQYISAGPSV